jgi:hypothetical protein
VKGERRLRMGILGCCVSGKIHSYQPPGLPLVGIFQRQARRQRLASEKQAGADSTRSVASQPLPARPIRGRMSCVGPRPAASCSAGEMAHVDLTTKCSARKSVYG